MVCPSDQWWQQHQHLGRGQEKILGRQKSENNACEVCKNLLFFAIFMLKIIKFDLILTYFYFWGLQIEERKYFFGENMPNAHHAPPHGTTNACDESANFNVNLRWILILTGVIKPATPTGCLIVIALFPTIDGDTSPYSLFASSANQS